MIITTTTSADLLHKRLQILAREAPELGEAVCFYTAVLPLVRDAACHAGTLRIPAEEARRKLADGEPLLSGLALEFDLKGGEELLVDLVRTVGECFGSPTTAPAAQRLDRALAEERLHPGALVSAGATGDRTRVDAMAREHGLNAGLTWTLARYALRPAFQGWRQQAVPLLGGNVWHRGHCPVCGTGAVLGELRDNNQVKHLRCSECGADWPVRRLQCARCGNEDHRTQQFLYAEGEEETMRVELCDRCQGYLKVIATFAPTPPELLPVEELRTLHLDRAAQARGYRFLAQA